MDKAHLIEIKSEIGLEFLRAELHERHYTWWWTGGTTKTNTFWTWRCSFSGIDPFVWWPGEPNNDYEHNYQVLRESSMDLMRTVRLMLSILYVSREFVIN